MVHTESRWVLSKAELNDPVTPVARVIIDEIDAWKLFTKSIERDQIKPKLLLEGDLELGQKVLETVSVIA